MIHILFDNFIIITLDNPPGFASNKTIEIVSFESFLTTHSEVNNLNYNLRCANPTP